MEVSHACYGEDTADGGEGKIMPDVRTRDLIGGKIEDAGKGFLFVVKDGVRYEVAPIIISSGERTAEAGLKIRYMGTM